jgi:hypothetical protein
MWGRSAFVNQAHYFGDSVDCNSNTDKIEANGDMHTEK